MAVVGSRYQGGNIAKNVSAGKHRWSHLTYNGNVNPLSTRAHLRYYIPDRIVFLSSIFFRVSHDLRSGYRAKPDGPLWGNIYPLFCVVLREAPESVSLDIPAQHIRMIRRTDKRRSRNRAMRI